MKSFRQYTEAMRPDGQIDDRSLEGFRNTLDQLQMFAKAIINPEAKQEIQTKINQFLPGMKNTLLKYKSMGIGYSPNYRSGSPLGGADY